MTFRVHGKIFDREEYMARGFMHRLIDGDEVPGLVCKVKKRRPEGINDRYLVFLEKGLIKWKIEQEQGTNVRLYHHNTYGSRGFHMQSFVGKLHEAIEYIKKHEREVGR